MKDYIRIPHFENYHFNCNTLKVVNIHTKKALKPKIRNKKKYFRLYENGISCDLSLFKILQLIFSCSASVPMRRPH